MKIFGEYVHREWHYEAEFKNEHGELVPVDVVYRFYGSRDYGVIIKRVMMKDWDVTKMMHEEWLSEIRDQIEVGAVESNESERIDHAIDEWKEAK